MLIVGWTNGWNKSYKTSFTPIFCHELTCKVVEQSKHFVLFIFVVYYFSNLYMIHLYQNFVSVPITCFYGKFLEFSLTIYLMSACVRELLKH